MTVLIRLLLCALAGAVVVRAQTAPAITTHPVTQSVAPGGNVTFSVTATGDAPLTYQWTRNGTAMAGATGASLPITNAQLAQAGRYQVRVTNPTGSVLSAPVELNLIGTLWAMGYDNWGQLGLGRTSNYLTPRIFAASVAQVWCGREHTVFLNRDGTLWASGRNPGSGLGFGAPNNSSIPTKLAEGVVTAAAGDFFVLFVKGDGSLWTVGANGSGQLGDGTTTNRTTPVQVGTGVAAVAAGTNHALFVKSNGSLWAMGANGAGQLGDGTTTNRAAPVQVSAGVAAVAAGESHSVFIRTDGTVWTVGANASGQLGNGSTSDAVSPVQILTGAKAAAAGYDHTLILKEDGTVWSFGSNAQGQLCSPGVAQRSLPAQVAVEVSAVAAGTHASALVKKNGSLWVAGSNYNTGRLGVGTIDGTSSPVQVATDVTSAAFGDTVLCYVTTNGSLWGAGLNERGQLPDGSGVLMPQPARVAEQIAQFDLGSAAGLSLVLKADGSAWSVGRNFNLELGDGTGFNRSSLVSIGSGFASVAAGWYHGFLLRPDGTAFGVGLNHVGQLGDAVSYAKSPPGIVGANVIFADGGETHSLWIKRDGTLWTMGGNNNGELGDGTNLQRKSPVQVATEVVTASSGSHHTLFIKSDGTLWGFGSNWSGILGDGTTTQRNSPVQIATGVKGAAAGSGHSLFLKQDGSLWGMGNNAYGALGDGTTLTRLTPIQITAGVVAMSAGANHSLFLREDGTLWAMGLNAYGQLGDGTTTNRTTPVLVARNVLAARAAGGHSYFTQQAGVGSAPILDSAPAAVTAALGTVVTLSAAASGDGPIDYRWQRNGVDVAGARSATLYLPSLQPDQLGSYSVIVSNAGGSVASTPVAVNFPPPVITTAPASGSVVANDRTRLTVLATGTGTLSYQWYRGSSGDQTNPIAGATASAYVTPALTAPTFYWVRVSDAYGNAVNSSAAAIAVSATSPLTVTHEVLGPGYVPGGAVTVRNRIVYTGPAPSRIDWAALLPVGWKYIGGGNEPALRPAYQTPDLLEWAWTSVPPSPIEFTYTVLVPARPPLEEGWPRVAGVPVAASPEAIASLVSSTTAGSNLQTMARPDPLTVPFGLVHSADTNRDGRLSLLELTRVIELYNTRSGGRRTGEYRPRASTEDGFDPGP